VSNAPLVDHACKIAEELGVPVFPIRVEPHPSQPGKMIKRPLIKRWQNGGAVIRPDAIQELFAQYPEATHVGLQTGGCSRILAIDLDGEPGRAWWREHAELLPATRTQRTQRPGGLHLLYRIPPGCGLRNSAGKIAPGVDIRANGGFIADWSIDYLPEGEEIADAPAALIEFLQKPKVKTSEGTQTHRTDDIPEGERNDSLTRFAGKLRRGGAEGDEIEAALLVRNARLCNPPLPDSEVADIACSVARYEPAPELAEPAWSPPHITSYGEAFTPAAIPRRQWLIYGRYASGECTAIVGPPGTNKSSLLLTDAVQLVTGRSLIGDCIERGGEVLFLVGEDRRRDFEARLAALCEYYGIWPAELGSRLHVVYQSEINAAEFSLGNMVKDIATLNSRMFDWVQEFPNLAAVFIDPLLSWHRLFENDNVAMQTLCAALRGLAVRANIAVAFDHHVTKVSMSDSEAHVGNLSSVRGSSSIGADVRWAFTLAKLNPKTAALYGITEEDRIVCRRLDTLKASYGPDQATPRLLKIESVRIANGESVGVLTAVDPERLRADGHERRQLAEQEWRQRLGDALARMLCEQCPQSATEAARWLASHEALLFVDKKGTPVSDRTIRRNLPTWLGDGLDVTRNNQPVRIIIRATGTGNGRRREIDFEEEHLA
jgi:hypothetical protein